MGLVSENSTLHHSLAREAQRRRTRTLAVLSAPSAGATGVVTRSWVLSPAACVGGFRLRQTLCRSREPPAPAPHRATAPLARRRHTREGGTPALGRRCHRRHQSLPSAVTRRQSRGRFPFGGG